MFCAIQLSYYGVLKCIKDSYLLQLIYSGKQPKQLQQHMLMLNYVKIKDVTGIEGMC